MLAASTVSADPQAGRLHAVGGPETRRVTRQEARAEGTFLVLVRSARLDETPRAAAQDGRLLTSAVKAHAVPLLTASDPERRLTVGAATGLASRRPVTFANVTIRNLEDRRVRLRFTAGGASLPAPVSYAWPAAQALVAVRVSVVVLPKF